MLLFFNFLNFFISADKSFVALKFCFQEFFYNNITEIRRRQKASGKANDIGVVVFAAHFGGLNVVAQNSISAFDFVGGDTHALAGAADENAKIVFVFGYGFGEGDSKIRKIVGFHKGCRAQVFNLFI